MDYTIYKITCNDTNITDCYVGQTKNFTNRKYEHNRVCNNPNRPHYDMKVYSVIRENGGWSNWKMSVIEIYNCIDKFEATKWERYHYEKLNATLNTTYPGRTKKESYKLYRENNSDKLKEKRKLYRENNSDKLKEQSKLYYINNTEKEFLRQKIYKQNNKEKLQLRDKLYYENNQSKLMEQKQCECGVMYSHSHLSRHLKTQRHHKFIEEKSSLK
tara:strand:- start:17 stop:661 length:645 start_codon:yes stop_codon:yes gene_type:complete